MKATVIYVDRDYKTHKKIFRTDPNGSPENELDRAKKFAAKLEAKDKKDPYGLYRSINIELS